MANTNLFLLESKYPFFSAKCCLPSCCCFNCGTVGHRKLTMRGLPRAPVPLFCLCCRGSRASSAVRMCHMQKGTCTWVSPGVLCLDGSFLFWGYQRASFIISKPQCSSMGVDAFWVYLFPGDSSKGDGGRLGRSNALYWQGRVSHVL